MAQTEFSLATLVSTARLVNYSTFASMSFLLFDYLLTLDTEIRLIWNGQTQRIFGKVLYILARYTGLITLSVDIAVYVNPSVTLKLYVCLQTLSVCEILNYHGLRSCEGFHWWETTTEAVAVLSVELILMTRIYAVYEGSKKLLVVLGVLFVGELAGTLVIVDLGLPRGIPRPFKQLTGCYTASQPPLYFLTWIPALAFESILCFLMLFKAWNMYKDGFTSSSSLMRLIIRDSVLYFLTVFATLLLNCLIWAFASRNLLELALGWAVALPCALGSRLLLNMRERVENEAATHPTAQTGIRMQSFRAAPRSDITSRNTFEMSTVLTVV